ncbi:Peptidyl-alpha-hydroxyglycine alpha-amidating lyase 1 [Eumeta japonica]|uniref:Peptidyl-alpha-hydroxyglycine alpha-amidating lyase 1 n=1 Tax=Eumeta variegata TaxID=151549 RepID=A0A4C1ZYS5_EUMVA|nr:Peptidyl-alpha-hydroxyglycine alpha-amidating lyase 1 [Eumeta japonica]
MTPPHQLYQVEAVLKKDWFIPGDDETHFCKPSAVAVRPSGEFFVADGYCNTRIINWALKVAASTSDLGSVLRETRSCVHACIVGLGVLDPTLYGTLLKRMQDDDIAAALLEENVSEDDENYPSDSDHNSDHISEASESDSDTDMEDPEPVEETPPTLPFYTGKDGKTKWYKTPPRTNVRTRSENIITHLPGCKPAVRDKKAIIKQLGLSLLEDHLSKRKDNPHVPRDIRKPIHQILDEEVPETGQTPYTFNVPHALTLVEDRGLVCVANRERGRVPCYSADNATFHFEYRSWLFGGRLFSVAYAPVDGGRLYVVNGPHGGAPVRGYVIDFESGRLIATFAPPTEFHNPHDVAVTADGSTLFVAELDPHAVYKFESTPTATPEGAPTATVTDVPATPSVGVSLPTKPTATVGV